MYSVGVKPKERVPAVSSMHIWALQDPADQAVANRIDEFKPKDANKQISLPEIRWARHELDKLLANRPSKLAQVPESEREDFAKRFARIEAFFEDPSANLALILRPKLRLAGKVYDHVFELRDVRDLDATLMVMKQSGYDLIVVRDEASKAIFVAISDKGRLHNCQPGTEAVLETEHFDQVSILRVEDLNNGFYEGLLLIPRKLAELASDVFSGGANRITSKPRGPDAEPEQLDSTVRDIATYNGSASVILPKPAETGTRAPGVVLASAIGVGAVGFSTLVATAPEAAGVLTVISVIGSLYNAFFGAFRKRDPYFILNVAGVQLNDSITIKPNA
jgi:hypothetical protein